jgi:hypothetical protein
MMPLLNQRSGSHRFSGAKHALHGWVIILLAIVLTVVDIFAGIRRCVAYFRSGEKFNLTIFWQTVVLNKRMTLEGSEVEYAFLVGQEPEEYEV